MKVFVVSVMLLGSVLGAPGIMDNQVHSDDSKTSSYMSQFVGNCADSSDIMSCLAIKGITALNRAARSQNIELVPGVTFVRDPNSPARAGKSLSENEIAAEISNDKQDKTGRLLDLAVDSISNFVSSHNLEVKLPQETTQEVARYIEEGRGKIKKIAGPLILAIGAKVIALIPLFLGGVVLLATKAVIVAKIAFILAAVLAFQRLGGSGGSGLGLLSRVTGGGNNNVASQGWANAAPAWSSGSATQSGGWSSGASSSYPYARSYDAQELAYNAQAPAVVAQQQQTQ